MGMRSKFTVPVLASILILGAFTVGYSFDDALAKGNGQPKVTICHVDQETGEKETITVSNKAVDKHKEKHGDELGECVDEPEPFCELNDCDDFNECTIDVCDEEGDSCSNTIDEGAACGTDGTCDAGGLCVEPFCGDGTLDAGEACDDGNNANGDGCDSFCMIETETFPDNLVSCICTDGSTIPVGLCIESCDGDVDQICEGFCLGQTGGYAAGVICIPSDLVCADD